MIHKAFILGAGLGTRLRPLTNFLPKPLVPLFHEPMANYALRHCQSVGVTDFAINTHHLADEWHKAYPENQFEGASLEFFHENTLLETGGGIRNISSFIGNEPLLIYNGDIYTDIDISKLIKHHEESGNVATLALRSTGDNRNVSLSGDLITDMRNTLKSEPGTHQFTGIYCINPEIIPLIPDEEVVSIIPAFIELIKQEKLGGVVLDEGDWFDIGNPEAYLDIHQHLLSEKQAIHSEANIHPEASIDKNNCVIGPNAVIPAGAQLNRTIVWKNAQLDANKSYDNEIITS